MFTPLNHIVPKAVLKMGIRKEVQAAHVCHVYRSVVTTLVHPQAADQTFAHLHRGSLLIVSVPNSAWAQVIMEKKQPLLDSINANLGKIVLKDIKTKVELKSS